MTPFAYFPVLILAFAGGHECAAAGPYRNARELMVEAIVTGHAAGVMNGAIAQAFAAQFGSHGDLLVDATVERALPEPGCKRLQVNYTQRGVPTLQGTTAVHLNTRINYCLDGHPPIASE
ncbi:MAG: hypothetical protein WC023_16115 [Rhodocyclaceae bacterium]